VHDGEYWTTGGRPGAGERAQHWQEMLSATHLPWTVRVEPDAAPFEAWIRRWWIDDLALVDCTCDPCSGTRGRRQMAGSDGEFVVVLMTLAGRETVGQDDSEVALRPGDAVVWDSTRPARFRVGERLAKRSLLVPRAAVEEVAGRSRTPTGVLLDGGAPATRLLVSYLDVLRTALPTLGPSAVAAARNATLELLVGALRTDGAAPSTPTAQPALRAAMDRWIGRHLADGPISPGAVAAAHGVSIRTVNRVFNATGDTVTEVIRVRRLARAREELAESDRSVASIAHRWGFADTSHFSRSFKARYGTSPSAYRLGARGEAGAPVQRAGAAVHRGAAPPRETGVTAARG
jgi:AraC family transcriptional regulator, positive regulator of tynA and feaB